MNRVKGVIFDWAGTTVDFGSLAPAAVFQEVFRQRGVPISARQAREPMGMSKREHIAAIASNPDVKRAWTEKYGAPCSDSDIERMYLEFLPLQKQVLRSHCKMIDGVVAAVEELRRLGLKIGSSTGYTRELMEVVSEAATEQGYEPDCVICADDVQRGRPAPFLIFEAAQRLDLFPLWEVIVVDDTEVGIQAGRNAGCWTIGISRTGNCVGMSEQEFSQLSEAEQIEKCRLATDRLRRVGAHYVIESVADIVPFVVEIDANLERGQLPIS